MSLLLPEASEKLAAAVREFRVNDAQAHIDVTDLCKKLGLGITIRNNPSTPYHRGDLERINGRGLRVVVYRLELNGQQTAQPLSPAERFTVVHEIAHFVLLTAGFQAPTRRAEYWQLETLCNEFAYELLLPRSLPLTWKDPSNALQLLALQQAIANRSEVTVKLACRWVCERYDSAVAGMLLASPLTSTKRIGYLKWLYNSSGSWRKATNVAKAVYVDDCLSEIIELGRSLTIGSRLAVNVGDLVEAAVVKLGPGGILLAGRTGELKSDRYALFSA